LDSGTIFDVIHSNIFTVRSGFVLVFLAVVILYWNRNKKRQTFVLPTFSALKDPIAWCNQYYAKTFREGDKAMMVHGGANKAGRFLEVSFLAVGGRKGVIWLPEGRFGRGWRRFAGELRHLLEAQRLAVGSEETGDSIAKVVRGSSSPGVDPKRSFMQALCASPAAVERADPVRLLDTFPVSKSFETQNEGEGLRVAVDCAALEALRPRSREAAGYVRVPSTGDEDGVKKLLGLLHLKLDRVLSGLPLRPTRWRRKKKKGRFLGREVIVEKEPGPEGEEDPNMGVDLDLGSDWVPDSILGMDCAPVSGVDPGSVSDLKLASSSGEPGVAYGPPELPTETSPCAPETHGSGADPGSFVEAIIGVVGDKSAQGEESIGELQDPSSRSPEMLTEKTSYSPEHLPDLSLNRGSGVDAGSFVEASRGVVGDRSAQGEGSNGELLVRFPDFPLPWESDGESDGESDSESDSGAPVAGNLAGEEKFLTADPPPVKSLIKRGFFGPRADASSTAVVESIPVPACELIRRGSQSIGMADLGRGLSHPVSPTSGISKSELGYFQRVKDKAAKQRIKNKELLVEDRDEGEEGYSSEVHRKMKMASLMGVTWGGEDKKMLDMLSAKERKAKGLRELKNLNCSVSPVKSQRRKGRNGSKFATTFPPEVH
jgi:hypothetical protein